MFLLVVKEVVSTYGEKKSRVDNDQRCAYEVGSFYFLIVLVIEIDSKCNLCQWNKIWKGAMVWRRVAFCLCPSSKSLLQPSIHSHSNHHACIGSKFMKFLWALICRHWFFPLSPPPLKIFEILISGASEFLRDGIAPLETAGNKMKLAPGWRECLEFWEEIYSHICVVVFYLGLFSMLLLMRYIFRSAMRRIFHNNSLYQA